MVKRERQRVVIVGGVLNGLVTHGSSDHVASSFMRRHSNLALPSHHKMSVSLNPSSALGFRSAYLPFLALVVAHRVPQDH